MTRVADFTANDAADRKGPRILLLESNRLFATPLRRALQAHNYDVSVVSRGLEALRNAWLQPPDLAILQMEVPGLSGLMVCEQMRTWLRCPIVLLSCQTRELLKIAALDAGADDYLIWPFSLDELLARVRALFRRSSGSWPSVPAPVAPGFDLTPAVSVAAAHTTFCNGSSAGHSM